MKTGSIFSSIINFLILVGLTSCTTNSQGQESIPFLGVILGLCIGFLIMTINKNLKANKGGKPIRPEIISSIEKSPQKMIGFTEEAREEEIAFKNNINPLISRLEKDTSIFTMVINYISKFPAFYFTNPQFIINVESCFSPQFAKGQYLLLSNQERRDRNRYAEGTTARTYFNDNLVLLSKYISENGKIADNTQSLYVTYLIIYRLSIKHFSKLWEDQYKEYFTDINAIDVDEAISRYCQIETIDPTNQITAGTFIYFLIDNSKYKQFTDNYLKCYDDFIARLNLALEKKKYQDFVERLKSQPVGRQVSIDDVDMMDGLEFEQFIAKLFSNLGYHAEITRGSGDQGIDIIATKNGKKTGIQAKRYSGTVGNGAIQEAVAGIKYYQLDKAIVVTNNYFSKSAQELASSNSIILWDRNILKEKVLKNNNSTLK